MAIIKCDECGREISDKASYCIYCGNPIQTGAVGSIPNEKTCGKNSRRKLIVVCTFLALLVAAATYYLLADICGNGCSEPWCIREAYRSSLCLKHYKAYKTGELPQENEQNIGKTAVVNVELPDPEKIAFNNTVEIPGRCSFAITSYTIEKIIEPPFPEDYYTYYEAPDGNTFVDIKMEITNLGHSAVSQNSLLSAVKVIYDGDYEYVCGPITETNNGKNLQSFPQLYAINPLVSMNYHYVAVVPEKVAADGRSLNVMISVGEKAYECQLR